MHKRIPCLCYECTMFFSNLIYIALKFFKESNVWENVDCPPAYIAPIGLISNCYGIDIRNIHRPALVDPCIVSRYAQSSVNEPSKWQFIWTNDPGRDGTDGGPRAGSIWERMSTLLLGKGYRDSLVASVFEFTSTYPHEWSSRTTGSK